MGDGTGLSCFMDRLFRFCGDEHVHVVNVMDEAALKETFEKVVECSALVVVDIHRCVVAYGRWRKLLKDERVGVAFDMFDCGVLFFDRKKVKQVYKINYR